MFKKIFILCFSGNQGGMELDAVRMCRRVSAHADVTLICMSGSAIEAMALQDIGSGFKYRLITSGLTRFFARALVDPRIVFIVRGAVKQHRPDLLIFFGTSEVKSIGLALLGLSTKLVLRIGTTISRPKSNLFQRIAYRRVNGFIAISEHIKNTLLQAFPIAKERVVEICYPVIDVPVQHPSKPVSADDLSILYQSRFVRGKGQLDAVLAFEKVCKRYTGLSMILVGAREDEAYCQEIERYIESKQLAGRIKILEPVADVSPFLRQACLYLGPSYGEGFSNSFAEALGHGLVCVVYDNTVFPYFKELRFDFVMSPTGDTIVLGEKLALAVDCVSSGVIDTDGNAALARKLFSAEAERQSLARLFHQLC